MKKLFGFFVIVIYVLALGGFCSSVDLYPVGQNKSKPAADDHRVASTEPVRVDKSIFTDTMVELTWPEVQQEGKQGAVVLFPIAVVEEHGPHMDLSPDIYLTVIHCRYVKKYLQAKNVHAIIAPPFYWGINDNVDKFPGSFTVKPATFKAFLFDSLECLKKWGFNTIFFVNDHGDSQHQKILHSAIAEARQSMEIETYVLDQLKVDVPFPSLPPPRQGKYRPDYHAGANETAEIYYFFPDKVKVDLVKTLPPQPTFEPLGYGGDPASFQLDIKDRSEGFKKIAEYEAEKIAAFLRKVSR